MASTFPIFDQLVVPPAKMSMDSRSILYRLRASGLLKTQGLIDGKWLDAYDGKTLEVRNPATGEVIAIVPCMGARETNDAIASSYEAFKTWSKLTAAERSKYMRNWYDLLMAHREELAQIITLEQGKPLKDAIGEVTYGASYLEFFAEEAKRVYGDIIPTPVPGRKLFVLKQPVGVVAAITPWNFPLAMITRKLGPALATGCTMVIKPSEFTPLSALAAADLALKAGIPPEGLKTVLEVNVIPAFEMSCKSMFEQVDAAFQKGMSQHIAAAQHQMDSAHSSLAMTLRETINSASSISQSLSGELAEQRRLLALAAAGAGSKSGLPSPLQINGPLGGLHDKIEQQPFDPKKELSRLISEHKYEEAFTTAMQRSDVSIVSWLCSQVELQRLLSSIPLPLSQGVLLSLLQQVACDITKEPSRKLQWMTDVAAAINPSDPMIAAHVRPIFEQVYQILNNHRSWR